MQSDAPAMETDNLILEGIVVTLNSAGQPNIAPMGPRVDRDISRLALRPFRTSKTYENLKSTGCGVLHVTDDVDLLARAAIGWLDSPPKLIAIDGFACPRLSDACRWFAFRAAAIDEANERATIECEIVAKGELRPFFGFNRAKHAVVEASILATRIRILPAAEIYAEMQRLSIPVQKTGGQQERRAFDLVARYIHDHLAPVA